MNIALDTLKAVAYSIVTLPYVFILIVFAYLFYRKNRKITIMQKMIIGRELNSSLELTISQIVLGLIAGALGSIMLSYLGVTFNENTSIELIFLVSILLMFIKPKYICFSYSGAVLGVISILIEILNKMYNITVPKLEFLNVDIVSLMTLVAIIHFVEGILVMLDGSKGAIPIFTKKEGKIIGGFALKRYWAIPVAIALFTNVNINSLNSVMSIRGWNPLLKPSFSMITNIAMILVPFYGVIGYSGVTFTKDKKQKAISSGVIIMIYSILLFIFARLAVLNIFFKMFVVIFAPSAHELMLYIQKYREVIEEPKYVSDESGMMVLEVAPNSPADQMGIKSGDTILEVNNKKILREDDILNTIKEASNIAWFKIKREKGILEDIRYKNGMNSKRLGIVFVPVSAPKEELIVKVSGSKFKEILENLKKDNK